MAIPSDNYSIGYGVGRLNFTMHLVMHVQFPSTHNTYRLQVLYDLLQAS